MGPGWALRCNTSLPGCSLVVPALRGPPRAQQACCARDAHVPTRHSHFLANRALEALLSEAICSACFTMLTTKQDHAANKLDCKSAIRATVSSPVTNVASCVLAAGVICLLFVGIIQ